jgi:hypothetical protein
MRASTSSAAYVFAQAIGELREDLVRRRAVPVDHEVREPPRACQHRLEQQRDDRRRDERERRGRTGLHERTDASDDRAVDDGEEDRDRADDHGLPDHHVDVVEPVLEYGKADRDRDEREGRDRHVWRSVSQPSPPPQFEFVGIVAIIAAAYRVCDDDARSGEPADLEPERRVSPPVADHEADRGSDDPERHRGDPQDGEREERLQGFDAERILQVRVTGVRH